MTATGNLSLASFLHHGISRMQAEELLLAAKEDGCFLLRESETVKGAYTLCIMFQGRVHQYRVLPDENAQLYVQAEKGVQQRRFVDLLQLVHEYLHRGDKNGLACALRYPIGPSPSPTEEVNDKDDSDEEIQCSVSDYAEVMTLEPGSSNSMTSNGSDTTASYLSRLMFSRFSQLNLSNFDGGFVNDLRTYVDSGIHEDSAVATSGGDTLNHLRSILAKSARDLERQLELYLAKIDSLRHLFGPITTPPLVSPEKLIQKGKNHEVLLPALLDRLCVCRTAVTNLEKKAIRKFEEIDDTPDSAAVGDEAGNQMQDVPRRHSVHNIIPPTAFEAKMVKHSKNSKVKLTVDIQSGKLFCVKPTKEVLDASNVFPHNKVEQLIKNTSNKTRLDIKIEGRKKETYVFESVKERENFCQLMQQLKNLHSAAHEVENISIFIGTWNMAYDNPPANLGPWLMSQGLGKTRCPSVSVICHDLYVIGTQESALTEKEWTNRIKSALYENFTVDMHTVAVVSLWSIRIMILVKKEFKHKISTVQHSSVKTGIANALGNKGAVGVSFNFNGTSLCFINSHLTSGIENNARRNQNFHDIIKGLNLGPKGGSRNLFDLTNQFHHLFFLGDLNYRLDGMDAQEVIKTITVDKNYGALLEYDQLGITRKQNQAFVGFNEDEITFPPTYRIEKDTIDKYIWQKQKKGWVRINCPSWCDRVLWRSYPETYIRNSSYGCVETIVTSDHKPVFSSFDVGIITQYVSTQGARAESNGDVRIIFTEIKVEAHTSCREHFFVEFHSPCLEDNVRTSRNRHFGPYRQGVCLPMWGAGEITELEPIIDDIDYLEDQHLHLAIKSADGMESYGECVLPLKNKFGQKPHKFFASLIHSGVETGKIMGFMHVKDLDGSHAGLHSGRMRRSYELVYMDTDTLWAMERERDDNTLLSATSSLVRPPMMTSATLDTDSDTRQRTSNHMDDRLPAAEPPKMNITGTGAVSKVTQNPRKPRLGQSSLARSAAPPQTSAPTAAPRMQAKCVDTAPKLPQPRAPPPTDPAPPPPPPAEPASSRPASEDVVVQEDLRRVGMRNSTTASRDNPVFGDEKRVYSTLDEMRQNKRESFRKPSSLDDDYSEPPTPPPRHYQAAQSSPDLEYAALRKPSSINEWLLNLGLPQYIQLFMENGWDHIDFISSITITDLESLGIPVAEHRQRIHKSIQDMKSPIP